MNFWTKMAVAAMTATLPAMAHAQQTPVREANYDLAERFSGNRLNDMVFSTVLKPNWFEHSDRFWYSWTTSEGTGYYIVNPDKRKKEAIFDLDKLAMEITEITGDPFDAQHLPLRNLKLVDDECFTFEVRSSLMVPSKEGEGKENKIFRFSYDLASRTLSDISGTPKKEDIPSWASVSPDSTMAVYCKGMELYWADIENIRKIAKDDKDSTIVETRITFDAVKDFAYGGDDYKGHGQRDSLKRYPVNVLWSPDSKHFATERFDMRQIKDLWVINILNQPRPELESYKYQMPAEPGPKTYIYLFDTKDMSSTIINTDRFKDQSVYIMAKAPSNRDRYDRMWLGDNEGFYLERRSRDLKRADICRVDIGTDTCRAVISEKMNTYVETRPLEVVSNGKELIHWSERNGWAHLYLYDSDGNLKNAITKGAFHVESIEAIDEKARVIYFNACGVNPDENPYYMHLYRINFDGSGMKLMNPGNYDNKIAAADNGKCFVNSYSRVDTAPANILIDASGRKIMDLETADLSLLFEAGYRFPEPFKVKAADGITDLYGVMYKPFDFDSTKLYPIIEYVYPGPQVEATNYFWSRGMNRTDRLAQLGFIVVTVGNRGGHPNRSKWYHNFGYGNLRDYGLEDQKYAVQQLAARHPFIDINRVGIHGHSGGGFMSTAAILTYPDFYKAAVSCAGNHDNSIYNRWWSEQHHGILEEITAEGDTTFTYSIDKNQDIAGNLAGRLLLVTGDMDDNVHPGNTMRVAYALIKANKRFDLLILPGDRHGFEHLDEYFFWRLADHFSRYLIGDCEDSVNIRQMNNDNN